MDGLRGDASLETPAGRCAYDDEILLAGWVPVSGQVFRGLVLRRRAAAGDPRDEDPALVLERCYRGSRRG